MAWHQIIARLRAQDLPRAEALLRLTGAAALAIRDAADDPIVEPAPGTEPLWPRLEVRALFAHPIDVGRMTALLGAAVDIEGALALESFADADWIDAWRERLRAREFPNGFWIIPAETPEAAAPARHLRLAMGLAFGTGQHPTTALCLEWLAAQRLAGEHVLDYGCGSGILALAALKLGAARAWAVDEDPQALAATARNARLNGLEAALWSGRPEHLPQVAADVVLANIVAGTLARIAGQFSAWTKPGATIVLSGLLPEQCADLEREYARSFEDFRYARDGDWVRLVARRKSLR